jgi:hypothetical protein
VTKKTGPDLVLGANIFNRSSKGGSIFNKDIANFSLSRPLPPFALRDKQRIASTIHANEAKW